MRDDSHFSLFDGDDGGALLLTDYRGAICFDGNGDPAAIFAQIEAATAGGAWVALAAEYGLGFSFEPGVFAPTLDRPLLQAWIFGCSERLDTNAVASFLAARLAAIPAHENNAGIADLLPGMDAAHYAEAVAQIRQWIADGDCYQINFTFPLDFQVFGHPLALYAGLRERQPVRYGGYIATPEATLLSFSPELFFERRGDRVVTRPMKGTAPRGQSPAEDAAHCAALLASDKERAENVMIVDLLRSDLGRLAQPGKVRVDALCAAEAYPTLWQMVSTVSADLPGASLLDLFRALFPCGSITGAPKIRAMQRITELEGWQRGLYTGALGWVAPGGDCRFNVAIRTLEIRQENGVQRGRLGVGSGIVIDADPASEYAECLLKAHFLTGFDPGFELFETLRLEAGAYPLLNFHLDRLRASAHVLGFSYDAQQVTSLLADEAKRCGSALYRVRLTLAHDGTVRVASAPQPDEAGREWQVVLASERLDADDPLLRHKTTARSRYDRALAALADQPDVFDAIFLNTRGEVCEGARSNVFVERNGMLLTPPLACGLLPGVMRRQLIASGRAVEQVLRLEDLQSAPAIYVANALRGLMPVRLSCK
jgi:para-aminobenzoate synthetase/4-amino-4-deoxychorismate lyase